MWMELEGGDTKDNISYFIGIKVYLYIYMLHELNLIDIPNFIWTIVAC